MKPDQLLLEARRRSGLSRRELARRAGTSQATLFAYEHGRIRPGIDVLERILLAAGFALEARLVSADEVERGRILAELLDLAEQFPWRPRGPLAFPILAGPAR